MTVSDFILKRVHGWGIRRIYGYPGDGINGIMGAFDRLDGAMRLHPGPARRDGRVHGDGATRSIPADVACCMATSGPGAIHLFNGLYDAKMDHRPVVAIVGQAATTAIGGNYQQEVDLVEPVQGRRAPNTSIRSPARRRRATSSTARFASHTRRAASPASSSPKTSRKWMRSSIRRTPQTRCSRVSATRTPVVVPIRRDLRAAADVLNAGERVAMLIGAGTLRRRRGSDGGRGPLAGGRRESIARESGAARRSALRDRYVGFARHRAQHRT